MSQPEWLLPGRTSRELIGSLLISAISIIGVEAAAATYKVVDLAKLDPRTPVVLRGLNNAGLAVGGGRQSSENAPNRGRRGLLLRNGGTAQPIDGPPASDYTTMFGLNDAGGFVGTSNTRTAMRAFSGAIAGGVKVLPPLGGDSGSAAFALNQRGQAVGFSTGAAGQRAVTWDPNGNPTVLPVPPGMSSGRATGINQRGDISGVVNTAAGKRPVVWPGGQTARELLLLAGHATGEAFAVNARGDIVGYSANAPGLRRATFWPSGGGVINLGTLPGGDFSYALDSNDAGDVVGSSSNGSGSRAFLWTRTTGLRDLNSQIPPSNIVLTSAVGINNLGMILVTGHDVQPGHAAAGNSAAGHGHEDVHELPVRVFLLVP